MLYEVKIKLTSAWLGQQRTKEQIRRFRKLKPSNNIAIDNAQWQWAFQEAADALHLNHVDVSTIYTDQGFEAPTLQLYNRRYTHNGKPHQELFESIRENTVITLEMLVTTPTQQNKLTQSPSKSELDQILCFVGRMLGLSPWGSRFGFGRFKIESIEEK